MCRSHHHAGMIANLNVQKLIPYVAFLLAACAVNIWVASIGSLVIVVSSMMHGRKASENIMVSWNILGKYCIVHDMALLESLS